MPISVGITCLNEGSILFLSQIIFNHLQLQTFSAEPETLGGMGDVSTAFFQDLFNHSFFHFRLLTFDEISI